MRCKNHFDPSIVNEYRQNHMTTITLNITAFQRLIQKPVKVRLRRNFAADPLQVQQRAIANAICGWLKLGYRRRQKDRSVRSGRTRRP
jgi:hypothetical protein